MTTLVQSVRATEQEVLVAKNAELIVDELKKMFFDKLPKLDSLIKELSKSTYGMTLEFKKGWLDKKFSPASIRNISMSAASDEFSRWFKEMFGIEVRVFIEYVGDNDMDYTGIFWANIVITPRKRRLFGKRR